MTAFYRIVITVLVTVGFSASYGDDSVSIEDFGFLTGYWKGTGMGGKSEEVWMPPVDGSMFGIFKQSSDQGLIFTELMEITELEGEFILRLKHFNPDFSAWEEKADYLKFNLSAVSENRAEFGGLRYEITENGGLKIDLDMQQGDGSVVTETFNLVQE